MARTNLHYTVRPRYSGGSPSLVPEDIALKVADDERRAHQRALTGFFGDEEKAKAEKLGVGGIVELAYEKGMGWMVRDELTGRVFFREKKRATKVEPRDIVTAVKDSAGNEHQGRYEVERTHRSGHRVYLFFKGWDKQGPVDLWHSDDVTVETDMEPFNFKG